VQSVAVLASVSRKALAKTSGVVALTSAAALVRVVVGGGGGVDLTNEVTRVGTGLDGDTSQLGGATIVALIIVHNKQVLGTLDVVTSEGNKHIELESSNSLSVSGGGRLVDTDVSGLRGDLDTVNHLVGKHEESQLNIIGELIVIETIRVTHDNGDGGEGLVQLGLEGKSESLGVDVLSLNLGETELHTLNVLGQGKILVDSVVKNVVTVGAHSLGAVKVTVQGVTHAGALLVAVPVVVGEGLGLSKETLLRVIVPGGSIVQVLDVLAGTVAGAIVGTGSALAALALIAIEALALASVTTANTSARAL